MSKGPGSFDLLQTSLTNDLNRIGPGRAQYQHLLDETDASVLDDLIVWWVAEERFDVMPNASNTARVISVLGGHDVTGERAVIAVQGPRARERLATVSPEAAAVGHFAVADFEFKGVPCRVAGTGYTGEDGVECAVPSEMAPEFWRAVVAAGVKPAGLGARDTLRLESGLPLHGHELGAGITPLQAGLGWVVSWDKGPFRGREALERERTAGVRRRLRGLLAEGRRPPRNGDAVLVRRGGLWRGHERQLLTGAAAGDRARVLASRYRNGCQSRDRDAGRSGSSDRRQAAIPAVDSRRGRVLSAPFVAHTEAEIAEMLGFLGLDDLDGLFGEIPEALRLGVASICRRR